MLSRRSFVITAGGVAGAAAGGGVWATLIREQVENAPPPDRPSGDVASTPSPGAGGRGTAVVSDRVLVVLEMAGGNDALNTVIPAAGAYRSARPGLAVPEVDLISLAGTDAYGFHPSLRPLTTFWDDGSLAAVHGVGMLDQSRSHFKAMDTWWSATPGASSTTGWLGRWLDATLEGEPDPLRAIALGGGARALAGLDTVATVVRSPAQFQLRTADATDADALVEAFLATSGPLGADPVRAAAQSAIPTTLQAIDVLARVTGAADVDQFGREQRTGPAQNSAASLLQTAAGIIDLGIGTRVITVGINGFDTHADQAGTHADLLADVADGIEAFFATLAATGHADDVLLMTTSEFGRRVAENGSGGTDHGNAGAQLLVGPAVRGGQVVGDLDLTNLDDGDVPTTVDTRSVYSVALDWLGGPTDELLDGPHDRLGLVT